MLPLTCRSSAFDHQPFSPACTLFRSFVMSDGTDTDEVKPRRMTFRRKARDPLLSEEHIRRQSQITHLAFTQLGSRDEAVAFLNTHNEPLGGRPLDRAMSGAEGYAEVETVLKSLDRPPAAKLP